MTEELKRSGGEGEQITKPTSETEQAESTSTEPKETPSETTPEVYDKGKVSKLISAAEAAVQAAKDKELAQLKRQHAQELREAKARQEQEQLRVLEEAEKQKYGEADPNALREIQELRRRVFASAAQTGEVMQHGYALKLAKQYGVDPEALLDSASPDEMETKAKSLVQKAEKDALKGKEERIKQLEEELEIAKKPPQKVAPSALGGTGDNWRELSPDDKIKRGLSKSKK